MKNFNPTLQKYFTLLLVLALLFIAYISQTVAPQTRQRTVGMNPSAPVREVERGIVGGVKAEVVKVDVDLVRVEALVLQKNTARVVGNLNQADFVVSEDGAKQSITHFSQNTLPLSVLLLIDRGGCLDPFGSDVQHAAREALQSCFCLFKQEARWECAQTESRTRTNRAKIAGKAGREGSQDLCCAEGVTWEVGDSTSDVSEACACD